MSFHEICEESAHKGGTRPSSLGEGVMPTFAESFVGAPPPPIVLFVVTRKTRFSGTFPMTHTIFQVFRKNMPHVSATEKLNFC